MSDYQRWKRFLELASAMDHRPAWLTNAEYQLAIVVSNNPSIGMQPRWHRILEVAREKIMENSPL